MSHRHLAALSLVAFAAVAGGCGTSSGGIPAEPAETNIYVSGGTGLQFELVSEGDTTGCPPNSGVGIQGPTSNHQFPDRTFLTPHLFVLENAKQPVQAVIRNLDTTSSLLVSITIATNPPQQSNVEIPAGACVPVRVTPNTVPNPKPGIPDIAVEVCAPCDGCSEVDTNVSCVGSPIDPISANIAFFSSIGDVDTSNISNCLTSQTDACITAATIFFEQPKDQIAAVMQVNPGQAPGFGKIRSELYINGQRVDSSSGGNPIVQHQF